MRKYWHHKHDSFQEDIPIHNIANINNTTNTFTSHLYKKNQETSKSDYFRNNLLARSYPRS